MTLAKQDFERFMTSLFVAFPNVYQFLKFSVDIEATKKVWYSALSHFEAAELHSVLNEWIHAPDVPFKSSEIGFLQNIIRARINFQRDQISKLQRSQEEAAKVENRKRDYRPVAGLYEIYIIGLRANEMVESGQMSEAERQFVVDDLVQQAGKADLQKVEDPIQRVLEQSRRRKVG